MCKAKCSMSCSLCRRKKTNYNVGDLVQVLIDKGKGRYVNGIVTDISPKRDKVKQTYCVTYNVDNQGYKALFQAEDLFFLNKE